MVRGAPKVTGRYLRTVEHKVYNCYYETVTLDTFPGNDAVWSINGKLADARSIGFAIRQDVTSIWSPRQESVGTKCDVITVYKGEALLDGIDVGNGTERRNN